MCADIADAIGEKLSVVDLVMWRYATLQKNYLELFPIRSYKASALKGDFDCH
jgi:hypothetical protein